jgi:sugar lactone lactonase YvrE
MACGWILAAVAMATLAACGGGGGGDDTTVTPQAAPTLAVFAGGFGGTGNADGPVAYASFTTPRSAVADAQGNVYVADGGARMLRKITTDGRVVTVAGSGAYGYQDGQGAEAQFKGLSGLAMDASGNVLVADEQDHRIRKVTPEGVVTTLAGTGALGLANGPANQAKFANPTALVLDAQGNVLVADAGNHQIRMIGINGYVSTWVGSTVGRKDGAGGTAMFNGPSGLAKDGVGNIYVADCGNHSVRVVNTAGVVSTAAGTGAQGLVNAAATSATFNCPQGVAIDASGQVFVADYGNHALRRLYNGNVTTWVGGPPAGDDDGTQATARFWGPRSLGWRGDQLLVADQGNGLIRLVSPGGVTTTLAGSHLTPTGASDGVGSAATFVGLTAVAVDAQGHVYVGDAGNCLIRKITPRAEVSTWVGAAGSCGSVNGWRTTARIGYVAGLGVDSLGNLYVADANASVIRKVTPEGMVSVFAGSGQVAVKDGQGTAASFGGLSGLAVDRDNNVYVSDGSNHVIRKVTPAGLVSTLAGTAGQAGLVNDVGSAARFKSPVGLAVDAQGQVYVADGGNFVVRKITSAGAVSTLAGKGSMGSADGAGDVATFGYLQALTTDAHGNVLVTDLNNALVRKVSPDGTVSTLLGTRGRAGFVPGALPGVIRAASGLAVHGSTLYVTMGRGVAMVQNLP